MATLKSAAIDVSEEKLDCGAREAGAEHPPRHGTPYLRDLKCDIIVEAAGHNSISRSKNLRHWVCRFYRYTRYNAGKQDVPAFPASGVVSFA
jgi:hypothetical protein